MTLSHRSDVQLAEPGNDARVLLVGELVVEPLRALNVLQGVQILFQERSGKGRRVL